jgi:hypothetical protein
VPVSGQLLDRKCSFCISHKSTVSSPDDSSMYITNQGQLIPSQLLLFLERRCVMLIRERSLIPWTLQLLGKAKMDEYTHGFRLMNPHLWFTPCKSIRRCARVSLVLACGLFARKQWPCFADKTHVHSNTFYYGCVHVPFLICHVVIQSGYVNAVSLLAHARLCRESIERVRHIHDINLYR